MEITGVTGLSGIRNAQSVRPAAAAARRENAVRRFDEVSVSANASFAQELKSRLAQEVRTSSTTGRLASLRQQVREGSYHPDPAATARRMLLMAEEA